MSGQIESHYELRLIRYQDDQHTGRAHILDVLLRGRPQGTIIIKNNRSPEWNAAFVLSFVDASDRISIHVKRKRFVSWWRDHRIGEVDVSLSDLLKKCVGGEVPLRLLQTDKGRSGMVYVSLRCLDNKAVARISGGLEKIQRDIEHIERLVEKGDASVTILGRVVGNLDKVVKIIDEVTKLNACLNLSWQILSAMYKIVSKQIKTDQKLVDLVGLMKQTFEFANDAKSLPDKTRRIQGGFKDALELTLECSRFVQEYTAGNFAERTLKIDAERKIDSYSSRFADLKKQIDSGVLLAVGNAVDDIDNNVTSMKVETRQQLDELKNLLKPFEMDASILSSLSRCLPGTRTKYIKEIKEWAESETAQNVLWLNGIAGVGKSTIAATVMDDCDDRHCLASYIFFRRGNEQHNSIIRTIAYQVAAFSPEIAKEVLAAVKQFSNITGSPIDKQFRELLLKPLSQSYYAGKHSVVTIILDALDECGSESQRRDILQLLQLDFSKLPNGCRFLVTSRPENDIMKSLTSQAHIYQLVLDHNSYESGQDVLTYIRKELQLIDEDLPDRQPFDSIAADLNTAANGLFIWASTAMKMIRDTDDPKRELKALTSDKQSGEVGEHGIDRLYETVLMESGIKWEKADSRDRFTGLLGLSFFGKGLSSHLSGSVFVSRQYVNEYLSVEEMECFLGLEADAAKLTLGRLRSVLSYESGKGGNPIRLHHASFFDYLTSRERSGNQPWHIDEVSQKCAIAKRCFDVMEKGLCFNICGLESPFVRNEDVPDLEERIKNNIPRHLEYACLSWAEHLYFLSKSIGETILLHKLKSFVYERLLYWFEVLSLTERLHAAQSTLKSVSHRTKTLDADLASFLQEASDLARILAGTFGRAISESTPHLYLSALSFSKFDNCVAGHYSKMHPTVSVSVLEADSGSGLRRDTPDYELAKVLFVSSSPDGRWVTSASRKMVNAWSGRSNGLDAELTGHEELVTSVVFFPDERRVVSGSLDGTVRIWDIDTRKYVIFGKKVGSIWSVAVSTDGKLVASTWNKVYIWNIDNGELVGTFDTPSERSPVAISPNGTRVASVYGTRVRLWNVNSGAFAVDPFRAHRDAVTSLAFSPDGSRVVSASEDKTLRMWDAFSGNLVAGPFVGHTEAVRSVVFSPDGKYVASGSWDGSIRIWDAKTAQLVAGPFYGHASDITSLAWTSDGACIASGSADETVRIWDANKLLATQDPIDDRTEDTTSAGPSSRVINGILKDGWVLGERGELLLWLPQSIQRTLWSPQTIAVIGVTYETRLDFTNYSDVLGKTWKRLSGHQEAHNGCPRVSSGLPTDPTNSADQENDPMVSITAWSTPTKLLDE